MESRDGSCAAREPTPTTPRRPAHCLRCVGGEGRGPRRRRRCGAALEEREEGGQGSCHRPDSSLASHCHRPVPSCHHARGDGEGAGPGSGRRSEIGGGEGEGEPAGEGEGEGEEESDVLA
jgi:hypothetical protein